MDVAEEGVGGILEEEPGAAGGPIAGVWGFELEPPTLRGSREPPAEKD